MTLTETVRPQTHELDAHLIFTEYGLDPLARFREEGLRRVGHGRKADRDDGTQRRYVPPLL